MGRHTTSSWYRLAFVQRTSSLPGEYAKQVGEEGATGKQCEQNITTKKKKKQEIERDNN